MNDIAETLDGPLTLGCDMVMRGKVRGDVTVARGYRLELIGTVLGDLTVAEGGAAVIRGAVAGTIVNHGGDVEVLGTVNCVHDYGDRATRFGPEAKIGYERGRSAANARPRYAPLDDSEDREDED